MPRWTRQDMDLLKALVDQGLTYHQIAGRINRSVASIAKKARSLGITSHYHDRKYNDKKIFDFYKTHTAQETADKFGIKEITCRGVIDRYHREHPLEPRKDSRRKDQWTVYELLYMVQNLGLTSKREIGKTLNRGNHHAVKECAQRLHLSHTKYLHGLPLLSACLLLELPYDTKCPPLPTIGQGKFLIVPYEEILNHGVKDEIIKKAIEAMIMFKRWINQYPLD